MPDPWDRRSVQPHGLACCRFPGSAWQNISGGIQVGGGNIGTLTVANSGFVNGSFLGVPMTVGFGGGFFSGALVGDGSVTSTQINAGGWLVPGQGLVPG